MKLDADLAIGLVVAGNRGRATWAIAVEPEYRYVARFVSVQGPKGEFNVSITVGSEDAELTCDRSALEVVLPVCEPAWNGSCLAEVC
jgi:hypothetical protein